MAEQLRISLGFPTPEERRVLSSLLRCTYQCVVKYRSSWYPWSAESKQEVDASCSLSFQPWYSPHSTGIIGCGTRFNEHRCRSEIEDGRCQWYGRQ